MIALQQDGYSIASAAFAKTAEALPDSRVKDRILEFARLRADTSVAEIAARFGSSGYVVETVPLALFMGMRMEPKNFESTLNQLSKTVEDADTIGSIAGQIAGAQISFSSLPKGLVSLPFVAEVQRGAESFAEFLEVQRGGC